MKTLSEHLAGTRVIAAVKNKDALQKAIVSPAQVIFTLGGSLLDIADMVGEIKNAGKSAIVHLDLVAGLSSKEVAVDFIRTNTNADGIITTKGLLVKRAKDEGLFAIQRTFLVDSIALSNLKKQLETFRPDALEIMPGLMPKILTEMKRTAKIPVIAGGLLADEEDARQALEAGADAISTTRETLWEMA